MTRHNLMMVVALVLALACRNADAADDGKTVAEQRQADAVAAWLDREMPEVNFNGQGLADCIDFLRDISGGNFFINWNRLEAAGITRDSPVNVRLRAVPFRKCLATVLESVSTGKGKAKFAVDEGIIVISTEDDPKHPWPRVVPPKLPDKVDRVLPEVSFSGQGVADVMDFLRDVSGANIFVNWNALERAGVKKDAPVTVRLKGTRLSLFIAYILEGIADGKTPLQATYADNVITITTGPADAKSPVDAKPAKPENDGK